MRLTVFLLFSFYFVSENSAQCYTRLSRHYNSSSIHVDDGYMCDSFTKLQCSNYSGVADAECKTIQDVPLRKEQLSDCQNVNLLYIRGCFSHILESPFSDMDSLYSLRLPDNIIRKIEVNTLSNKSPELETLVLRNNGIREIEPGSFQDVSKLVRIDLSKNEIQAIKFGIVNNFILEFVDLSSNRLESIEDNAFSNMSRLKTLYLGDNQLHKFVAQNILNNSMRTLTTLYLERNLLANLDGAMLEGLQSLTRLEVGYNRICVIQSNTFSKTPKLKYLSLNNNYLTTLSPDPFPQHCAIENLCIGENRLTYLGPQVLGKLEALKFIQIGGNPWQCNCLEQILWWMSIKSIHTSKCDKVYLELGERPICVMANCTDYSCTRTCIYDNNPYSSEKYSATIEAYPTLDYCKDWV